MGGGEGKEKTRERGFFHHHLCYKIEIMLYSSCHFVFLIQPYLLKVLQVIW